MSAYAVVLLLHLFLAGMLFAHSVVKCSKHKHDEVADSASQSLSNAFSKLADSATMCNTITTPKMQAFTQSHLQHLVHVASEGLWPPQLLLPRNFKTLREVQ